MAEHQFRNQTWNQRMTQMGDQAEGAFEQWATYANLGYARYGLNRPPLQVHKLPPFIRYTPDYLMTKQLVEVQGFGRDQKFKLKDEKLGALLEWGHIHYVQLFAHDSTNNRNFMVPLDNINEAIHMDAIPQGAFPEGKMYHEFSADLLGDIGVVL